MTGVGFSRLAWRVWQRNFDVFLKTYKTNFIPPILEPVLYLVALGYGLGGFIRQGELPGFEAFTYAEFIGPALIAATMMNVAFFEGTFSSFVRMYYQKTYDAITATPVSLNDVIAAELLWCSTKAAINALVMASVVWAFGLIDARTFLLTLPLALLVGVLFGAFGVIWTAIVPGIDHFSWPMYLLVTPMFLFSGTFFPLANFPEWAQTLSLFLPLTHAVAIERAFALDQLAPGLWTNLALLVAMAGLLWWAAMAMMQRRLAR